MPILSKFGLFENGFVMPKDVGEVFDAYKTIILQKQPGLDLSTGSIFNLIFYELSEVIFNGLSDFENFYYSKNPKTATGLGQDSLFSISDLTRKDATQSFVFVVLNGKDKTQIPDSMLVSNGFTKDVFKISEAGIISSNKCLEVELEINEISLNKDYNLSINNEYFGITTGNISTTKAEIINQIANKINLKSIVSGIFAKNIDDEVLKIYSNDKKTQFSSSFGDNLSVKSVSSIFEFFAQEKGGILVNSNTINKIITSISGLNSCNNPLDGSIGKLVESDVDFRNRFAKIGIYNRSSSTENAILSAFYDTEKIKNINFARVETNENNTNIELGKVKLIVDGGEAKEIANLLWKSKAGGITTIGDISVEILDSQKQKRIVRFSRPERKFVFVKCKIYKGGDYELSSNFEEIAKNSILNYNKSLNIGDDFQSKVASGLVITGLIGAKDVKILTCVKSNQNQLPNASEYLENDIEILSNQVVIVNLDMILVEVI